MSSKERHDLTSVYQRSLAAENNLKGRRGAQSPREDKQQLGRARVVAAEKGKSLMFYMFCR